MRATHTFESVKEFFTNSGCELLSTEFKNSSEKLKYICKCGETKEVTFHGFQNRKTGCRTCVSKANVTVNIPKEKSKSRKVTYEIVKKEFEDAGCTLLSKTYSRNNVKLQYICSCGETMEKTYNCFQYKKGCMKCSGTPKYTYSQVKDFFEERDCVLLSKTYESVSKSMDYICECGNTSKISLSNLLNGHRCRSCRTYHSEYTTETVKSAFEEIGYILDDIYTGFDQPMRYTCINGCKKSMSLRRFKKGQRCCIVSEPELSEVVYELPEEINEPGPSGVIYEFPEENNEPGPSDVVSTFEYSSLVQNSNETTEFKSELLQELNNEFNTEEQSIFVNSFYCYLNNHPTSDFVVDLDIVCKFIGFSRKADLKKLLLKNFREGTDYKTLLRREPQQKDENRGGSNKETIMLNVDTFKGLCMLARTEQAKIIRTYYIKLESIVMKVINKSRQQIQPVKKQSNFNQDQINNSKRLLESFGDKKNVMYNLIFNHKDFGWLSKIGIVRELRGFYNRFKEHQDAFGEVCIHSIIKCSNIEQVEKDFKDTSLFQTNKVKVPKNDGDGNYTEIIKLSELVTSDIITNEIKRIAGDRILDPPPIYSQQQVTDTQSNSLEIEKEKTRQIELQEQELTKREQIKADLETKKLEFEMLKFKIANNIAI